MIPVPYRRRFLFADGSASLYPQELPPYLYLGRSVESERHVTLEDRDRAAHMYICGVTGSGKTRFLENLLVQDIIRQRPLCLLDPTGGLYRKALDFISFCTEIAERKGHNTERLLEPYLFLDIDAAGNPLRLNPLETHDDETTEEQVDDFLKVAERLFGSIDEMRRIRNTLRGTLWVIAELNRLPEKRRPPITASYPLNLRYAAQFLTLSDDDRRPLIEVLPDTTENAYVRMFWLKFFSGYTPSQKQERLESTWNILQYFLGDSLVSRFFETQKSTLHIPELLRSNTSLFCSLPLGKNLKGCQLLGTYLATKFQRAATRRPPAERTPYYLYIDEFHEFADIEFAKAAATLRQYNLRMINAHQSQSQPPFHTVEGRSILETIKGNSQVKVLFRMTREDAEVMTKEMFELSQQRHNFTYRERAVALAKTSSSTKTISFQRSHMASRSWSRADAVAIARTDSYQVGKTEGVNLARTLTQGFAEALSEGISRTITETESETITEMHSKAHGISVLIGENWSHMVNHSTGFTFSKNRRESLAVQHGISETQTHTDQTGRSSTSGQDYRVTDASGNNLVSTLGHTAYLHNDRESASSSSALGQLSSHAESQGQTYSDAIQQLHSTANAIGRTTSHTRAVASDRGFSRSSEEGTSDSTGSSSSESITETDTVSQARAKLQGRSDARGQTLGISRSQQESLARAFTQLVQFSESYSKALQRTVSLTRTQGRSVQEGTTEGESTATQTGQTDSATTTDRKVFFTLEGEREITVNDLQRLPQRHAVVAKEALAAVEVETYHIPDGYYRYRVRNLPAQLLRQQQERHAPTLELTEPLPAIPEPEIEIEAENESDFGPWEF